MKNGGKNKSVAIIILFRVNVFCTRFSPPLEVPLTHAAETGSPCGRGRVGGDISFESLWGPAVEFSSPTLHTLRHLRHVEASRTSRTSFKWANALRRRPRLWPPSTIHKLHSSMSRYEVIPDQLCRRERQSLLICSKKKNDCICSNPAESLGERKKKLYDSTIRILVVMSHGPHSPGRFSGNTFSSITGADFNLACVQFVHFIY